MVKSSRTVRISLDMLPAIWAVVIRRKVWWAVGWLLFWGLFNLGMGLVNVEANLEYLRQFPTPPVLLYILFLGASAVGAGMILFGLYGTMTLRPQTIRLEGLAIIGAGTWNIASLLLTMAVLRRYGVEMENIGGSLFFGVIQLVYGARELRKYAAISGRIAEADTIQPPERDRIRTHLRAFVKTDEDFFDSRIKLFVTDRTFLSRGGRKGFRGQLLDDMAILVSKGLDDCLCIPREAFQAARYNDRARAKVKTDQGERHLTLGPVSVLTLKRWAAVPVSPKDIQRAAKAGKPSTRLMRVFLSDESAALRVAALEGLMGAKQDPDARVAAAEHFGDPDADVRVAALTVCKYLRADALHKPATAMLRDEDARVRRAAAEYITAFPAPDAAEALRGAMLDEHDKRTFAQLDKAVKACEMASTNRYASS